MSRRKPEEPKGGAPEWMATFSDLVTLLLCFFVLLYSMANLDADKLQAFSSSFGGGGQDSLLESGSALNVGQMMGSGITGMPQVQKGGEGGDEEGQKFETISEELNSMYSDFKTYFAENAMEDKVSVTKNEDYLDITLKDSILFNKGEDVIRNDAIPILDSIASLLATEYPGSDIEITGHTDSDPIYTPRFKNNWYLSAARAITVGEYLIYEKGFPQNKIACTGRGEYNPVAPNDTEENKSKNRRVELRIYSGFLGTNINN